MCARRLECVQQVSAAYSSQSARSAANEDYIIELKLAAVAWFEKDERICKMCNEGEVENVKDFFTAL